MSDVFLNLEKSLTLRLEKDNIPAQETFQVGFAMDTSVSMLGDYANGLINQLFIRALPVADRFDDNHAIQCCAFSTKAVGLPDMTKQNYGAYIHNNILTRFGSLSGGTCFAPAIEHFRQTWTERERLGFLSRLLGRKGAVVPTPTPGFLILQTDGENSDHKATLALLEAEESLPFFTLFLTCGRNVTFRRVRKYAHLPNVGHLHIDNLARISDDSLYDHLLPAKLWTWLARARASHPLLTQTGA